MTTYPGTYITFYYLLASPTGKTHTWEVVTKDDQCILGHVKWFGRWTKYAFYPGGGTVYEPTCLREIADFCTQRTREQRQQAARKRKQ